MEKWVQWRESIYEVSNTGKVRNINTKKEKKQHKKHYGRYENDYMRVNLHIKGKSVSKSVHRLVAECYLGNYSEELEINHKNNLRYDNRVENLEMCNKEYNYQYSIEKGQGSARKPIKTEDGLEFKSMWQGAKFIKEEKNNKATIDHICWNIKQNLIGKTKSAYGYIWSYK